MRGKGCVNLITPLYHGITPAYAGKSYHTRHVFLIPRDHPRICGEKHRRNKAIRSGRGSPPHMRGKASQRVRISRSSGITPAYAGKSFNFLCNLGRKGDHPRICGEKLIGSKFGINGTGSPPHMRGKAVRNETGKGWQRITPAYAGKSTHRAQRKTAR